jgi:anti-sigma factor RsiW
MNECEKHTVDLMLYLDDELLGEELMDFLAHLKVCADCRASLEEQLALSAVLRRSRPLYSAPPELRARVAASLVDAGKEAESNQLYVGSGQWLRRTLQGVELLMPRWKVLLPAVLGMMLCFLLVSNVIHEVRLPDAQAQSSGTPAYRLLGARVVDYRGSQAGLVTYEAPQNDTISLLVASSKYAVVAGGVEVRSGDLVFHHRIDAGFQIITWSNHGLAYALVSRAAGSARGSCLVCHQSMADRNSFRPGL